MRLTRTAALLAAPGRAMRNPPVIVGMIARRVLRGIVVLVVLSVIAFAMVRLLPGDPVANLAGPYSTPESRALLTQQLGLDRSLPAQYLTWVTNALQGDLGKSVYNGFAVSTLIAERLPNTLQVAFGATIIAVGWGVPAGAIAAMRRGTFIDRIARSTTFLGTATPIFAFGVTVVLLATTIAPGWPTLDWVPFRRDPLKNLQALILPALVLGLPIGSVVCRFTRAALLDVFEEDYIRTALATGSSRLHATIHHGLRNAAGPVITIVGLSLAGMIGNAILIENVFAIPGVGQLTVNAIAERDYAVTQACILLLGVVYVVMNLIVDLLQLVADPRLVRSR